MEILAKLPELTDDGLKTLFGNAERLEKAGTKQQRAGATSLLPAIREEMATRKAAKDAQRREKATAATARRASTKRKAAADAAAAAQAPQAS